MALLSFVESAPRAYRLKAGNAASPISTSIGTIPIHPENTPCVVPCSTICLPQWYAIVPASRRDARARFRPEGIGSMTLVRVSTTLHWIGFCVGVRASAGPGARRWIWIIGSAVLSAAWLFAIMLLASDDFFRNGVLPPRIASAYAVTLAFGYLLLLSGTFRSVTAAIPQHWLIGIQTFRVLGGVFLIRYFQGDLPGLFAIPAGVGDLLTGILAPLVVLVVFRQDLCTRRGDRLEPLRHGRYHRRLGPRGAQRRHRHRVSDRDDTDLRRAARVPHPLLFADWPPAQNIAAAYAGKNARSRRCSLARIIAANQTANWWSQGSP
jgi:hypothetical protein